MSPFCAPEFFTLPGGGGGGTGILDDPGGGGGGGGGAGIVDSGTLKVKNIKVSKYS